MSTGGVVFLLTDFGARDHYAGQVRAVLARLAPEARILDITHAIEPFAIDEGAWMLEVTLPHLPADAVVLGVVDPGVGGSRRAIVARDGAGRLLVGPDNGLFAPLLAPAARRDGPVEVAGTAIAVREINVLGLGIDPSLISPTFHGRDIFAPAAAALASGVPFEAIGGAVGTLESLPPFAASPAGEGMSARVIHVDSFGNLITTLHRSQVRDGDAVALHIGGRVVERRARTFADMDVGALAWHEDSSGYVAIAVNRGSAAEALRVGRGAGVRVAFP